MLPVPYPLYVVVLQYELQWMLLDCDPSKPERDTCDELPEEPEKVRACQYAAHCSQREGEGQKESGGGAEREGGE